MQHPTRPGSDALARTAWLIAAILLAAGCSNSPTPTSPPPGIPTPTVTTAASPLAPRRAASERDTSFLEAWASTYRFTLGQPKGIRLTPDGSSVLFLRSGPRSFVQDLYSFDVKTGQERVLLTADKILGGGDEKLTAEELARRERMRMTSRGIAGFDLSEDGSRILVPLSGRLFIIELATGNQTELLSTAGFPLDPGFSPTGGKIACVRDGDLYAIDLADGSETRLTARAGPSISYGLAEFVAQEEMDRHRGYWWSPDASEIAFQETDTTGMEVFRIADPVNPDKPASEWPYPRAGKANASVKLFIQPLAGGARREVRWDAAAYPYLATVKWPKRGPLTIVVQNRTQTEQLVLAVEASGATRELLRERDEQWLNLEQSVPHWLADGSGFLWLTERRGDWQLELRSADGSLNRELTPTTMGLRGLLHVDDDNGVAYVSVNGPSPSGTDPTQRHVAVVPISDKPKPGTNLVSDRPVRLTTAPGHHGGFFAKKSEAWVRTSNLLDGSISWTVFGANGQRAGDLRSTAEAPPFIPNLELSSATVGSGNATANLAAAIIRPRDFVRGRRYPVIVNVYGGPHAQTVNATARSYVLQQWIADGGFIVVCIDGRGTPGRGREWERVIKNDLIELPLKDQADAVTALAARYPEMDASRVGIYGWSFGGYFSAHAVMRRPDVFHAGVAGAPVADWADYDTHYTERYMDLPQNNPEGYRRANVLTHAGSLARPLLIIHGTADDNVYFMHSLKMTEALFRAGKEFEFLPLAGFTHMVPDPLVTTRLYARIAAFFERELGE